MVRLPSWRRHRDRRARTKAARAERRRLAEDARSVRRRRWAQGASALVAPQHRSRVGWAVLATLTLSLYWIAFGTSGSAYDVDRMGWGTAPFIAAAAALPLLLVRLAPMAGWVTSAAAAAVMGLVLPPAADGASPWPWLVVHTLVLLSMLTAVAYRERLLLVLLAWAGTTLLLVGGLRVGDTDAGWAVATTTVAVAGWLAGRLARSRRALTRQEELRAGEEAARVLLEERARIARDLHDIVAHRMSLVAVQAETARYRRPGLSPEAVEELAQIAATAREALVETRSLLGVLRQDDAPPATAPQPGVEEVAALVADARRVGLSLDAEIDCPPEGLGANVSLTAYRVVQESLANVARHAPGSTASLRLVRTSDRLLVVVRNTAATGAVHDRGAGPTHGLTGMRERVASAGGTLAVGPTADGGFEVSASLPAAPRPVTPAAEPGRSDERVAP